MAILEEESSQEAHVKGSSHQVASKDLTVSVSLLVVHEHGGRSFCFFHWHDVNVILSISFIFVNLGQVFLKVLTFSETWGLLLHISLGFELAGLFDELSNFHSAFNCHHITMLSKPHFWNFVRFESFAITSYEQHQCISDALPFGIIFILLKAIYLHDHGASASRHHISAHFQITSTINLICKIDSIHGYSY